VFRLREVCAGRITLDGVDLRRLPLAALRARLAVVPQEPVRARPACSPV
jgi:ABC-type multidrug transport system fused ATPase/permease subunit